jgi:hypothetical protein
MGMSNEVVQGITSAGQVAGSGAQLAQMLQQPTPAALQPRSSNGSGIPVAPLNNFPTTPLKLAGSAAAQPSPLPLVQPKSLMDILSSLSNGR